MRIRCSGGLSEVLVDDGEHTKLTIESIPGKALLEVFDAVVFGDTTAHPGPEDDDGEYCL